MMTDTLRLKFELETERFQVRDGRLVTPQGIRDKVCIVGFAPSWKDAPFTDYDFDIWCLNEFYEALNEVDYGRASLWFEIHSPDSPSKQNAKHQAFLSQCPIPIVMQEVDPRYPTSVAYPLKQVLDMTRENFIVNDKCDTYTNYSNQVSWMVYLAVLMGYKEIHVYGVDMAHESEYAFQRPSCEAAMMWAAAKGVKVARPKTSELCHFPRLYGFETDNAGRHYKKNRLKQLQEKRMKMLRDLDTLEKNKDAIRMGIAQIDGAITEINHDLTNAIV